MCICLLSTHAIIQLSKKMTLILGKVHMGSMLVEATTSWYFSTLSSTDNTNKVNVQTCEIRQSLFSAWGKIFFFLNYVTLVRIIIY